MSRARVQKVFPQAHCLRYFHVLWIKRREPIDSIEANVMQGNHKACENTQPVV